MKRVLVYFIIICMTLSTYYSSEASPKVVQTGIERLVSANFSELKGKKVGLITNPTGVDRQLSSTIDIMASSKEFQLVALFGPEHGVRGDFGAGDEIQSQKDPSTGLPVYSLYGKTRKPTKEMLQGLDVLVYDIQDIGSRSYTYISTLGLAMEAAAENNLPFIVLDRPNPLGGKKIEGCLTEPGFISFVSQFPIPYVHGLTVGELAIYLNEEGLLSNGIKCKLKVIPMKGWKRTMTFDQTGLPWVPSSPHIPQISSTIFYSVSGILGELYVLNIGVGYTLPFEVFAADWINAEQLCSKLNHLNLEGLKFRPIHYTPYYSVLKGKEIHGVQVHLTNYSKANLSLVQFYVMQECHRLYPDKDPFQLCEKSRISMFDKVCGTDKIRKLFVNRFEVNDILPVWNKDIEVFKSNVKKYLLYR